jgi:hypothetical protein
MSLVGLPTSGHAATMNDAAGMRRKEGTCWLGGTRCWADGIEEG